jgi:translation initiation factor 1A
MPQKNKGKGGKRRRRGKKDAEPTSDAIKITTKADKSKGENYGRVTKLAGDCRVAIETPDNESILCHIPGKFRKRVWIKQNDIVLFCARPYVGDPEKNDNVKKGDILSLYTPGEIRWLVQKNEIPATFSNIELTSNADGNQDINWNVEGETPMTLSEEEMENDSNIASEEKERMREERRQRNAVPAQQRNYDMPESEDSAEEDIIVNESNMEEMLKVL